ncbi:TonB-dependent receptor [Sphingopyxis sp.]|uniref:TonB-dependent receptor n=1 Tax=Sphingopyxis sp. TaxID=1908224 RepID=UPI0035B337EB
MKFNGLIGSSVLAMAVATPAYAQNANAENEGYGTEIVVTAQRQSERLQDVPIAVSAFSAESLEKQQIVNPSALQQTLPNVTFTKTNFTSSSFTIRGIGDLCVGTTCDSATAIHVNDMPLLGTRLFESEFFDLERVEVLRGPQGTLFGRNATSGVVNFITAKPDLSGFHAAGEFEYGNYDSKRVKAMVNVPLGDTLGIRVAGTWLNRDGYTKNIYNNTRIDDRDLYAVRGSLTWEPTDDTRIDLIGYYFHEKDNRSRIQKQLCHRDPTGVLGCLPDKLAYETLNGDATLAGLLTSREFLTAAGLGALAPIALNSIYSTDGDSFTGVVNPADVRTVRIDATPTYFTEEQQYTMKLYHNFGPVSLNLTGGYMKNSVDSTSDYNLAVQNSYANNPGLAVLNAAAVPGGPLAVLNNMRKALIPNGPGTLCQSQADPNGVGVYGGNTICAPTSLDFDRSRVDVRQYSAEAHIDSSFDGMFNFLLGGIYFDSKATNNDYFVNSFGLDYASGVLGSALSGGTAFAATPFYGNNTPEFRLKSYGIFGETYFEFNDKLKLTVGLRYNHDKKTVTARTTLFQDTKSRVLLGAGGAPLLDREGNQIITTSGASTNILVPYGSTDASSYLNDPAFDFDSSRAGNQPFAVNTVSFGKVTGRAVLDYKITDDNLIYASYSRGYKSGGINPPLSPIFAVPTSFAPEKVDAFEIGSKNTFGNGQLRLNLTGFYYKYKGLQLSRIVARTSVNDNINADIYGIEAEAVISPIRAFVVNANFSYLKSKVSDDRFLANPRDPSGGRSDAVIIKDLFNASNCAIRPAAGSNATAAQVNAFVGAVNGALGLQAPTAVPGTNTTGAYSVCSILAAAAAGSVGSFNPALAPLQGPLQAAFNGGAAGSLPFVVDASGVPVNVRGNRLPNAPTFKWAVGAQYTIDAGDWTIVPRADLNYTGSSWGTIFNRSPIDRIKGYAVINAQIQVNAPDDRFYIRGFVQNLGNTNATTGMYVTDQSSGLFTNIFTVEPRRYGVAVGAKF